MYLLDTTVLSDVRRPDVNVGIRAFLDVQPPERLFTSVACIGELWRGMTIMPRGRRRTIVREWIESDVLSAFGDRILPVSRDIAIEWGELTGRLSPKEGDSPRSTPSSLPPPSFTTSPSSPAIPATSSVAASQC